MVLSYGVFGDSYFVVLLRKKVVGGDDLNSCEKCLFSFWSAFVHYVYIRPDVCIYQALCVEHWPRCWENSDGQDQASVLKGLNISLVERMSKPVNK